MPVPSTKLPRPGPPAFVLTNIAPNTKPTPYAAKNETTDGQMITDLKRLLPQFPELKVSEGQVADALRAAAATENVLDDWRHVVAEDIQPGDEDAGY